MKRFVIILNFELLLKKFLINILWKKSNFTQFAKGGENKLADIKLYNFNVTPVSDML